MHIHGRRHRGPPTRDFQPSMALARYPALNRAKALPLPAELQVQMAPRFGHDFSSVRLHTELPEVARRGAQALCIGDDIAFAPGRYMPATITGRLLIAHELAHVVQQARGGSGADAESRADRAAELAISGRNVSAGMLGGAPAGAQARREDGVPSPDAEPEDNAAASEVDIITGGGEPATDATLNQLDGFALDSAKLTAQQLASIEYIAFQIWSTLSLYPTAEARVAISGHTDSSGSEKHNSGLGSQRAVAAQAALQSALAKQPLDPIRAVRISTTSLGESKLRVPTGDGVKEPRNRRVEIEVTIEIKPLPLTPPKRQAAPSRVPLPGLPGGPPIWALPGIDDPYSPDTAPGPRVRPAPSGPRVPPAPKAGGEWLEEALKRDPLLKKLPDWARDKAIGALKDGDEKLADTIIDKAPIDDAYKAAIKSAVKALLQAAKGRKYKPPPEPPRGIPEDMLKPPDFPKMPGEKIFKLPAIRF